ncbi:MAG TPA: hypothetical protein VF796_23495 [Humisphaera sp.]
MGPALLRSAVLSSCLALGGVVGCTTDAPSNPPPSQPMPAQPTPAQPKAGQSASAAKQEAKTMEKHGEQLMQKGDEIGGQRLIEQGKLKEKGADSVVAAPAASPTTVPSVAATTKPAQQ